MKYSRKHIQENPNIIKNWLIEHGDPAITKLIEKNFAIADKIKSILDEKNIDELHFSNLMDVEPSEVNKWLSGQHTFTLKTITKIENILNANNLTII